VVSGCAAHTAAPRSIEPAPEPEPAPESVRITLLQFNDVYEITPTGDGSTGGLARVATLLRELRATNPNTFAILAGDALSPSALGTARVDGERLQGRQMVAVLNALGLDFATFGNHEFDLDEDAFRARLAESEFEWLSANVSAASAEPLPNTARHRVLRVHNGAGDTVRLALFGATMDRDRADHVRIAEPLDAAVRQAELLRDSADVLLVMTHLPYVQDAALAEAVPAIDLIAGGHEHENLLLRRGRDLTPIAKADANVRSVYVHEIVWDPDSRVADVVSRLVSVTDSIAADSATAHVAEHWLRRAYDGFREAGFDPDRMVANVTMPLDGLESSILRDTTALTKLVASAMLAEVGGADAAIYNAGSIRIDDVIQPGPLSEYDVIRILPFGGPIVEVEISGALLLRVLDQGERNRGTGGFVQTTRIERDDDGQWSVAGTELDAARTYRVSISDFMLSGREQGMDWLTRDHAELRVVRQHGDVRSALIDQLERSFPRR
jgi:5'-nucleotidase